MKIKAIAPWFGGKRNMAETIIEELGPHQAYWEPFCGSLAVLLAKEPATMETVNDLNGDLINLARVLADESSARTLYARMSRILMHEDLLHEAASAWKKRGRLPAADLPDGDRAAQYMLCTWTGRNGVAGTSSYNQGFCTRYTKNGGHAAKRWMSAVDSIPDWHQRLRNVTILNRDGFEIIERIEDAAGVVIYVDPPYIEKGAKYVHDFEPADHGRLAKLLGRFKRTRVVVSYYDHETLKELYPGWTVRNCYRTKSLVSSEARKAGGEAAVAPEVLLMNGPSRVTPEGLFT